jgi:hypothetical protein
MLLYTAIIVLNNYNYYIIITYLYKIGINKFYLNLNIASSLIW